MLHDIISIISELLKSWAFIDARRKKQKKEGKEALDAVRYFEVTPSPQRVKEIRGVLTYTARGRGKKKGGTSTQAEVIERFCRACSRSRPLSPRALVSPVPSFPRIHTRAISSPSIFYPSAFSFPFSFLASTRENLFPDYPRFCGYSRLRATNASLLFSPTCCCRCDSEERAAAGST